MPDINETFRGYATGTTFHLSLGKTHIAALAELEYKLKKNLTYAEEVEAGEHRRIHHLPRAFRLFVPGMTGLIQRGLVEHILSAEDSQPGKSTLDIRPRKIWRITSTGRLVIGLLKEAGAYQEYAAVFEVPPPAPRASLAEQLDKALAS